MIQPFSGLESLLEITRTFFQTAAGELVNAQRLAEADKKNSGYLHDLLTGQTTRPQILRTIAARDAELALEYLYKTRPFFDFHQTRGERFRPREN